MNRPSKEVALDEHPAFALFILGLTYQEIAQFCGLGIATIQRRATDDDWVTKREAILIARQNSVTVNVSKTQEFIRAQEMELGRKLMGLGTAALAKVKMSDVKPKDILEALRLASQLMRLGTGLPANPVELEIKHTLPDNLQRALDKMYPQPKQVEEAKAIEVETKPSSDASSDS